MALSYKPRLVPTFPLCRESPTLKNSRTFPFAFLVTAHQARMADQRRCSTRSWLRSRARGWSPSPAPLSDTRSPRRRRKTVAFVSPAHRVGVAKASPSRALSPARPWNMPELTRFRRQPPSTCSACTAIPLLPRVGVYFNELPPRNDPALGAFNPCPIPFPPPSP